MKIQYVQLLTAPSKFLEELQFFLEKADKRTELFIFNALRPYWREELLPAYLAMAQIMTGLGIGFILLDFRVANGLIIAPLFLAGMVAYFVRHAFMPANSPKTNRLKIMEAVADRVLILPVAFYSLIIYNETLLFLIILSEIANTAISLIALEGRIALDRDIFAKAKTTIYYVVFLAIAVTWPLAPNFIFAGMLWLSLIFMAISIIFKLVAMRMHYETSKPKNLQHAFGEKRIIEAH